MIWGVRGVGSREALIGAYRKGYVAEELRYLEV